MSSSLADTPSLLPAAQPRPVARRWSLPLSTGVALLLLDCVGLAVAWPPILLWGFAGLDATDRLVAGPLYPACMLLGLYAVGAYRRDVLSHESGLARLPFASVLGAFAAVAAAWPFTPNAAAPAFASVGAGLLAAGWARLAYAALHRRSLFCRRIAVLGAGKRAWDLVWLLRQEGRAPAYRVHFLHDPALGTIDPRLSDGSAGPVTVLGAAGIPTAIRAIRPEEIVVAPDERRGMDVHGLLRCKIAGVPVSDYLGFVEREVRRVDIKRIEPAWLLYSDGFVTGPLDRAAKRVLDIGISLLGLLVLSPLLLAAMLAIRLQDDGPALYRQTRITRGGRHFAILKLRTMRTDAEHGGAAWAAVDDQRVTRLGTILRRTRLDEVPQLLNVLRGDMSFVGPRPERPEFVDVLARHLPLYCERHAVKAGLTGWAQINYPYGASIDDARSKLSYDLFYVKNRSVLLDLTIILQTARVVLWPTGAR